MQRTAETLGVMRAVAMAGQERAAEASAGPHAGSWACSCSAAVLGGRGGTHTPVWSLAGAAGLSVSLLSPLQVAR